MKQLVKLFAKTAAVAAIAAAPIAAQAEVFNFNYGSNTVATMTTSGNTTFLLEFKYAPAGSGIAFINDLLLGYSYYDVPGWTFQNVSGEAGTACQIGQPGCAGEGTPSDWKISWPTSNAPGTNRFLEGESSTFKITPSVLTAWDFSRLHINAFYLNGQSIKIDGCLADAYRCKTYDNGGGGNVPAPASLALLGLALAGAGFARRRSAR